MALFGIGQIGCSPNELAQNSPDGTTCVERINSANQLFNNGLKSLVNQLNNELPDARFIYVNTYGIFQDIIDNPSSFGNYFCLKHFLVIIFLFLCNFLDSVFVCMRKFYGVIQFFIINCFVWKLVLRIFKKEKFHEILL